jgi:hypothetical protein
MPFHKLEEFVSYILINDAIREIDLELTISSNIVN